MADRRTSPADGRRIGACASSARARRISGTAAPGVVVARPAAIDPPAASTGPARDGSAGPAFGRPLANDEEADERLTKVKALAVFSSDNLSSVAYATEAILFTLLAAGTTPSGSPADLGPDRGGARRSSSSRTARPSAPTPTAAAATSSRARTSGRGRARRRRRAPHRLRPDGLGQRRRRDRGDHLGLPGALDGLRVELAAAGIVVVMLINLRGVRESGTIFAIPTYVFVGLDARAHRRSASSGRSPAPAPGHRHHPARGAGRGARRSCS